MRYHLSKGGILTIPAYFLAGPNLSNFTPLMSDDYGYPKNGLFSCPHFCFRYTFIRSNQYGIDVDYLSDLVSTHFLGNFGQLHPSSNHETPKTCLLPCSHLCFRYMYLFNPIWDFRGPRSDFDDFSLSFVLFWA